MLLSGVATCNLVTVKKALAIVNAGKKLLQ